MANKFYWIVMIAIIGGASSATTVPDDNNCPKYCECKTIDETDNEIHAKCTSLKGLLDNRNIRIRSLDLSNANLTKISHLDKLRYLHTIDLSHNQLSDVEHLGRRIKKLNLSFNKITSAKLLTIPQYVEHLNLSNNEITYLPLELTIKLRKLKQLELIGNKINCTCETLEVRNWLQSIHVFMENFIKCSYPVRVKDLPWLQIKQQDHCDEQKLHENDENELMLSDQPMTTTHDDKDSVEELGKDFLPVKQKRARKSKDWPENDVDEIEGSGGDGEPRMAQLLQNPNDTNDEDDGSGSGMGPLFIPPISINSDESKDVGFDDHRHNDESSPMTAPMEETTDHVFNQNMGIFRTSDSDAGDDDDSADDNDDKDAIIPVVSEKSIIETINNNNDAVEKTQSANIMVGSTGGSANDDDNQGTYILLGIILFIVIALIIFVAIKRNKSSNRSRHNYDPENPKGTELSDMDKKNLGKAIGKNGTTNGKYEQKPLIDDKTKQDYAKPINGNNRKILDEPANSKTQAPLLNGTSPLPTNESNNNIEQPENEIKAPVPAPRVNEHEKPPRTHSPRYGIYPPPKSPRTDTTDGNTPSSPRQGRYSPVYSPETGKVKIKLTETPKPKTPMLVSRSNVGDVVVTNTTDIEK